MLKSIVDGLEMTISAIRDLWQDAGQENFIVK